MTYEQSNSAVQEFLESLGGIDGAVEKMGIGRQAFSRAEADRASLMQDHVGEYIAVGINGLIAHGENLEKVIEEVQKLGYHSYEYVIDFLDPNPRMWIL